MCPIEHAHSPNRHVKKNRLRLKIGTSLVLQDGAGAEGVEARNYSDVCCSRKQHSETLRLEVPSSWWDYMEPDTLGYDVAAIFASICWGGRHILLHRSLGTVSCSGVWKTSGVHHALSGAQHWKKYQDACVVHLSMPKEPQV